MGKLSMELYLEKIRAKYKKANKREKGTILDEFCEHSGYHKKHAIRLMNQKITRRKRVLGQRGRRSKYSSEEHLDPLKRIWLASNQICGKRLKEAMPM